MMLDALSVAVLMQENDGRGDRPLGGPDDFRHNPRIEHCRLSPAFGRQLPDQDSVQRHISLNRDM